MLSWRMPMSTETESGAPLRCAIYARKSTDEQAASTRVQVEEAGRFVQERGWLLEPGQVFIEDARSRAEFKNRPELFRMIDAAKAGHFEVLVVRDESRLGGDMLRTGLIIQDLVELGVRLFHYATGEEVRFDDATSQLVVTIRNFAAQMEREKTASRTYEHLQSKARKGHNAGGRVFGYRNVEVTATGPTGDEVRLRTEYEIDPEQAAVVRRIFELYAAGEGYRGIARILNDEGVASPRAGRRGSGSWGPTTIRSMILNERYRGFVPWNRYQKTYRGGTKVRIERPEDQWMRTPMPHLQIVSDELWRAAQAKRPARGKYPEGKKRPGRPPKYLLSGTLRCGVCGGPMQSMTTRRAKQNVRAYTCAWHRNRGKSVCTNNKYRPMDTTDAEVTKVVLGYLRDPELVERLMPRIRARLVSRMGSAKSDLAELEARRQSLRTKIERLTSAVEEGGHLEVLLDALRDRQLDLDEVEARLAAEAQRVPVDLQVRRLEVLARHRLKTFARLLEGRVQEARPVFQKLFPEGLQATPEAPPGKRGGPWNIRGKAVFSPDVLTNITKSTSPAGFEPALPA
jgi:site-specific DNA recombinase